MGSRIVREIKVSEIMKGEMVTLWVGLWVVSKVVRSVYLSAVVMVDW